MRLSRGLPKSVPMNELLINTGGSLKSLETNGDFVTVGDYGLLWGDAQNTDLGGDWFTPDTNLGASRGVGVNCLLHHAIPLTPALKSYSGILLPPTVKAHPDEHGLLVATILDRRNAYERKIYELTEEEALSWSSGAITRAVKRRDGVKCGEIIQWPIFEFSFTPTPAEFRMTGIRSLEEAKSVPEDWLGNVSYAKAVRVLSDLTPREDESEETKADWEESKHPRADDGKFGSGGSSGGSGGSSSGSGAKAPSKLKPERVEAIAKQYGVKPNSVAMSVVTEAYEKGHINSVADLHNVLSNSANDSHDEKKLSKHINEHGSGDGKFSSFADKPTDKGKGKNEKGEKPKSSDAEKPLSKKDTSSLLKQAGHNENSVISNVVTEAVKKGYIANIVDMSKVLNAINKSEGSVGEVHTIINRDGKGAKNDGKFRSALLGSHKSWDDIPTDERVDEIKVYLAQSDEEDAKDETKAFLNPAAEQRWQFDGQMMLGGALRDAMDQLCYSVLPSVLDPTTESQQLGLTTLVPPTKEERLAFLQANLQGFTAMVSKMVDFVLEMRADETPEEAAKSLRNEAATLGTEFQHTTFGSHSEKIVAAIGEYQERVEDLIELRAGSRKAGRVLSKLNVERLTTYHSRLKELEDEMADLLETHALDDATAPDTVRTEADAPAEMKSLADELAELELAEAERRFAEMDDSALIAAAD